MPQLTDALVSTGLTVPSVATAMLDGISMLDLWWKSGSTTAGAARSASASAPSRYASAFGSAIAPSPSNTRTRASASSRSSCAVTTVTPPPPRLSAGPRAAPGRRFRDAAGNRAAGRRRRRRRPRPAGASADAGPGREGGGEPPVAPELAGHVGARRERAGRHHRVARLELGLRRVAALEHDDPIGCERPEPLAKGSLPAAVRRPPPADAG